MTLSELKALINTTIRVKTAAGSITPDNVADMLDALADFAIAFAASPFTALTDASTVPMDYADGPNRTLVLTGNHTLNLTGTSDGVGGMIKVTQDATGGRLITLPGNVPNGFVLSTEPGETDIIGYKNIDGALYWFISNYGDVIAVDTTPPTVVSITATDSGHVVVLLSESVFPGSGSVGIGWTLRQNGTSIGFGSAVGDGTNTLTFGAGATLLDTDTITMDYDSTTGTCVDAAGNELVSFSGHAVINSIGGGGGLSAELGTAVIGTMEIGHA